MWPRFCELLGVARAHFAGNSMGAINLLNDATSEAPRLPVRSLMIICGGGEIQQNKYLGRCRSTTHLFSAGDAVHCRGVVSTTPAIPPTTIMCGAAMSLQHRARWHGEAIAAARFSAS